MSPDAGIVRFTLHLEAGKDADAEELDRLTRQLREEIQELDVESVEPLEAGALPESAKSAEALTLGALAVVLLPAVVPKLIEFLQVWSLRGENRTVKIKTQVADRALEVEFPKTMSPDELKGIVAMLTEALAGKSG